MVFMYLFTFLGIVATTLVAPFISLFGIMSGEHFENIVLPYDPEKELVWEYDAIDDPYIKLEKMTIDDDKQVFRFVSSNVSDDEINYYNGYCMDLIFTAQNGQTETYYAVVTDKAIYDEVFIAHEDECITHQVTVKRDASDAEFKWKLDFFCPNDRNILYFSKDTGEENTFTLVYFNSRPIHDGIVEGSFYYESDENERVYHIIEVDFSSGEPVVLRESGNPEN